MKAGRRRRKNLRARKKAEAKKKAIGTIGETPGCGTGKALDVANATKTAETNEETPLTGADPVDGTPAPVGVIPLGGGGPLKPNAPAYAGFFCGPPEKGEQGIMEKCNSLPVCKFKRVDDGSMGKIITSELEEGQGDCMRRCDTRFGLSEEVNCGLGEKCHSFIMGCPCPNLNDEECQPYLN